jgi:hypothetical protein
VPPPRGMDQAKYLEGATAFRARAVVVEYRFDGRVVDRYWLCREFAEAHVVKPVGVAGLPPGMGAPHDRGMRSMLEGLLTPEE